MNLRSLFSQIALVAVAATVLAQNPLPGPPANGIDGGFVIKPKGVGGVKTSQSGVPLSGSQISPSERFTADFGMDMDAARREKLALYFAAQFQKKNMVDTNRLVNLARELSAASEKTDTTLTLTELKKAEEIEKLAKRVKTRLTIP